MQQVESKNVSTPEVLREMDLEIVTAGKGTVGIAQRTVTPWIELAGNQAGFTIGESIGRGLGS